MQTMTVELQLQRPCGDGAGGRTARRTRRITPTTRRCHPACRRPARRFVAHWLSRDPIAERGGRNLYGFVYNNPIGRIDRLGLFVETCPGSLEAIAARCACKAAAGGEAGSAGGPLVAITCVAGAVATEFVAIDVGLAIEIAALEKQNEEDAQKIEEKTREYDELRNRCRQKVPPDLANPGNDIENFALSGAVSSRETRTVSPSR
jgi:hypothetical protein